MSDKQIGLLSLVITLLIALVGLCNKDDIKRRVHGWHDHDRPHIEREHKQMRR